MNSQQRGLHEATRSRRARFGEPHVGSQVLEADLGIDLALIVEHWRSELVVAEAPTTVPADILGDAALLAVHDHLHARHAVSVCMVAHLDADPLSVHFVGHGGRGA